MADFTRFISYLYDYRDGQRNRNLGFVKVETRQGMCRLTVNLNQGQVFSREMMLYGYIMNGGEIQLIGLGTIKKGERTHQWQYPAGNLGGSDLGPEGFGGLTLLDEERENFLLTVWKDEHIRAEEIRRGTFWQKEIKIQPKNIEEESAERETTERETSERENKVHISEIKTDESLPEKTEVVIPGLSSEEISEKGWRRLCHMFPAARPFEPSVWEVLCISLQDIGRLPPENWVWGNNHFVLHSFYQYHHLVLARNRVENRIYLGIPGEFGTNETFMAAMFGLHRFERERKGKKENGYWLVPVNLNDR